MKKEDCVFCNFRDREVLIYEDELCYAIISKSPINKHHVMIIPNQHYHDFIEIPDKLATHIFLVAKKLSAAVRKACEPHAITHISDDDISRSGWNLVEHYKFHIIPRFKDERVKIEWNRDPDPGIEIRSTFAEAIKRQMK